MNIRDPRNEITLSSLSRNDFECIESTNFPGHAYSARCIHCNHKLKINQRVWQIRHWINCPKRPRG